MSIVTLLSDFGTSDGYVGAMKGAVLSCAPNAHIVDITHETPPQDVTAGAWALRCAARSFPIGTIHVAVVDPTVGTARRAILLRCGGQLFVGPDNGLLTLAATGRDVAGWHLDRPDLFRHPISATFHGRDVFASVGGHLAAGRDPQTCGSPIDRWEIMRTPAPDKSPDRISGRVSHVDRFGNLISNILLSYVDEGNWVISVGRAEGGDLIEVGSLYNTFGDVAPGSWVAYRGSSCYLEVGVRDGSAASRAGLGRGGRVVCRRVNDDT